MITVNAVSKTYAMTGWRLGYLAARSGAIEQLLKIHQYIQACASSISQAAALEAVCGPQDCVHQMRDEFRARRDLLVAGFREMGVELTEPDGAFYLFPRVGDGDLMAERLAQAGSSPFQVRPSVLVAASTSGSPMPPAGPIWRRPCGG